MSKKLKAYLEERAKDRAFMGQGRSYWELSAEEWSKLPWYKKYPESTKQRERVSRLKNVPTELNGGIKILNKD